MYTYIRMLYNACKVVQGREKRKKKLFSGILYRVGTMYIASISIETL